MAKVPESIGEVFEMMPSAFKADAAAGVDVVFQFNISGDAGGDWYITIKDQTCTVNAGVTDSATTTMAISDEDYVKMLTKEADPMMLFTTGKLKINGDMMKSQLLGQLFEEPQE